MGMETPRKVERHEIASQESLRRREEVTFESIERDRFLHALDPVLRFIEMAQQWNKGKLTEDMANLSIDGVRRSLEVLGKTKTSSEQQEQTLANIRNKLKSIADYAEKHLPEAHVVEEV